MTEPTQPTDIRELVGFPREPIRKLKRADRALLKKALSAIDDPVMGIRVSLALNVPARQEWLTPEILDLAMRAADVAKYLDKLVSAKKLTDASLPLQILQRRVDPQIANITLNVLRKFILPKPPRRKPQLRIVLSEESALIGTRLVTALTPLLFARTQTVKKGTAEDIAEVVEAVVEGCSTPKTAAASIELLRHLEKHAGWEAMEKPAVSRVSQHLISRAVLVATELLRSGRLEELDQLASQLSSFESAQLHFKRRLAIESEGAALPLRARNWVQRYLAPVTSLDEEENRPEGLSEVGDASRERLALLLINAWEAREDGQQSLHAYSVAEEVCRNGFSVYILGDPGSKTEFDPDIHESNVYMKPGEPCLLVRPWIEWRSPEEIRVLIRARVTTLLQS